MSKGLGRIQSRVLATLEARTSADPFTLAAEVLEVSPDGDRVRHLSNAQLTTVRRALASLQRRGLAYRLFIGRGGRGYWATREKALAYAERTARAFGNAGLPGPLLLLWLESEKQRAEKPNKAPPTSPKGKATPESVAQ